MHLDKLSPATETPPSLPIAIANSPRRPCRWSSSRTGSCAWRLDRTRIEPPGWSRWCTSTACARGLITRGSTPEQTGLGGAYCKISYHKIRFWSCKSTIALSVEQHDVIRSVFEVELECFPISHQSHQGSKWSIYHNDICFFPATLKRQTIK